MNHLESEMTRSRNLSSPESSALIVVDVQEKLLSKIHHADSLLATLGRLVESAEILRVPILVSEQYPEKLGQTVAPLANRLPSADSKRMFSCRELWPQWQARLPAGCRSLVVCGIEAHVCVLQTVLDFQSQGWEVIVPIDAIGSRYESDYDAALRRMDSTGVSLVSTEMLMFEWCETSTRAEFKAISDVVKSR